MHTIYCTFCCTACSEDTLSQHWCFILLPGGEMHVTTLTSTLFVCHTHAHTVEGGCSHGAACDKLGDLGSFPAFPSLSLWSLWEFLSRSVEHKCAGNICAAVCVRQLDDLYPTVVKHIIIHNLLKWPISSSLARTHEGCLLTACELSDPECSQHGIVGNVTFQHGSTAIIHLEKERTGKRERKRGKDTKREKRL